MPLREALQLRFKRNQTHLRQKDVDPRYAPSSEENSETSDSDSLVSLYRTHGAPKPRVASLADGLAFARGAILTTHRASGPGTARQLRHN